MIRYFKKSFVRYLAYGLAIALLSFLFGMIKPKADSISIAEQQGLGAFSITIGGENYDGDNYFTVGANAERTIQVKMYNWEGLTRPWTYLMTSGCVANGYAGWSYLTNTSHTDHWFDETQFVAFTADTERECYTPAGRQGRIFYMQFRVGVYDDMDGTGEELQVGSYLHLVNNTNYSVQFHFYNWYLSSDDILTKIKNDAALLNAYNRQVTAISEQTNAINNQTNAIVGAVASSTSAINDVKSSVDDVKDSIDDVNTSINNDDVSDAENKATSFFNSFSTNTHGLTAIITAPLSAISSITSSTCSPLVLPLPFVDEDLTLPCMRPIYEEFFGDFMTLYDIVVLGIVSYWIVVRIFSLVKDFKNPEHDEVEVMEL